MEQDGDIIVIEPQRYIFNQLIEKVNYPPPKGSGLAKALVD